MPVPPIAYDFTGARIEDATVGPRREVTLAVTILHWQGTQGHPVEGIRVRFGGIENYDEVSAFFAAEPQRRSELAWLRYSPDRMSKPGRLFVELMFERVDARVVIECSNLQINGPDQPADGSS